ncbi:hypothetical protein E5329_08800 [Petralouisia muris]|uniref:Uncharacterized protein n=1 Tax=Petralouisia muris TaxID=3032872 RepID=A0AC61RXA8_9FIRM|nr:DUF308 domain-containing protein [Petralouisia muris]TGY96650.1 hypothetical protein E5329_08800 [Petralouisia muris]
MKIFTIILGVLMAICGVSCICTPVMTFLEAGYFLVILLLVYGIGAIVKAVMEKEYGLPFLFGILSIILGIVIMVVPGLKLMTDGMLIYFMAVWFLLQGAVGIFMAVRQKNSEESKGWVWVLILGILGVLVGIYSLVHPMLLAFTFGILVGLYFIESGISMIVLVCSVHSE